MWYWHFEGANVNITILLACKCALSCDISIACLQCSIVFAVWPEIEYMLLMLLCMLYFKFTVGLVSSLINYYISERMLCMRNLRSSGNLRSIEW
jgi:hypothetical protein